MIRVLIVGGGPAGMTAAIALARRGIGSEIVERETEWRPAGIGIGLQSPPMRAMRELDLLSPLQERSWHHHVIDMMRPDGMKVAEMPQVNVLGPDDPPFVTMSRMVLHEVLEERLRSLGVPVRLGTTVSAVRDTDDAVEVAFTDGSAGTYDLVVGADGVHSTTRPLLLPDAPEPAYAGQVIWRLDVHKPAELERYTMMLGRETRLGLSERRFERVPARRRRIAAAESLGARAGHSGSRSGSPHRRDLQGPGRPDLAISGRCHAARRTTTVEPRYSSVSSMRSGASGMNPISRASATTCSAETRSRCTTTSWGSPRSTSRRR